MFSISKNRQRTTYNIEGTDLKVTRKQNKGAALRDMVATINGKLHKVAHIATAEYMQKKYKGAEYRIDDLKPSGFGISGDEADIISIKRQKSALGSEIRSLLGLNRGSVYSNYEVIRSHRGLFSCMSTHVTKSQLKAIGALTFRWQALDRAMHGCPSYQLNFRNLANCQTIIRNMLYDLNDYMEQDDEFSDEQINALVGEVRDHHDYIVGMEYSSDYHLEQDEWRWQIKLARNSIREENRYVKYNHFGSSNLRLYYKRLAVDQLIQENLAYTTQIEKTKQSLANTKAKIKQIKQQLLQQQNQLQDDRANQQDVEHS